MKADDLIARIEALLGSLSTGAAAVPDPAPAPAPPPGYNARMAYLAEFVETPPPPGLTGRAVLEWVDMQHRADAELSRLRRKEPAPYTPSDWSKPLRALRRRRPSGW